MKLSPLKCWIETMMYTPFRNEKCYITYAVCKPASFQDSLSYVTFIFRMAYQNTTNHTTGVNIFLTLLVLCMSCSKILKR